MARVGPEETDQRGSTLTGIPADGLGEARGLAGSKGGACIKEGASRARRLSGTGRARSLSRVSRTGSLGGNGRAWSLGNSRTASWQAACSCMASRPSGTEEAFLFLLLRWKLGRWHNSLWGSCIVFGRLWGSCSVFFYAYVTSFAQPCKEYFIWLVHVHRRLTHVLCAKLQYLSWPSGARREQLWRLQCDKGHGRKTHRSPVSTAERLAVTKYCCKLPFGKPASV